MNDKLFRQKKVVPGVVYYSGNDMEPVEPDPEAAGREVWMLIQTMPPAPPDQSEPSKEHMKWMGNQILDAALGAGNGDNDGQ